MPKELAILSINFPFKASWVVQQPTLATSLAFFDFDVVVIRPYLLLDHKAGGPWSIDGGPYNRARKEMTGKIEDTFRLLEKGGLLVVLLDAVQEFKYNTGAYTYTGGTVYTLTNYDFLDELFSAACATGSEKT